MPSAAVALRPRNQAQGHANRLQYSDPPPPHAEFLVLRKTRFDDKAMWLDDLRPAFGEQKFFYEAELERLSRDSRVSSGQAHPLRGADGGGEGHRGAAADDRADGSAAFGRGMCVGAGSGSMLYRNDVIPPAPLPLLRGQ